MRSFDQSFRAEDGHEVSAYTVTPHQPRGTLIVIQEIFGVNEHIRAVAESFAAASYRVVAPRLFDRVGSDVTVPYEDVPGGRQLVGQIGRDRTEMDLRAVIGAQSAPVGVVGYCWGGSLAFLCASRLDVKCAVAYYGGQIDAWMAEMKPQVPVLVHYAQHDAFISTEAQQRAAETTFADHPVHVYPAGHGFNCDARSDFHPPSARLALVRTLAFLNRQLAPIG
jgi:carboxymethylenebutenolidase